MQYLRHRTADVVAAATNMDHSAAVILPTNRWVIAAVEDSQANRVHGNPLESWAGQKMGFTRSESALRVRLPLPEI